ncbi:hypothetical protein OGAPHI_000967 [Ogataea philodendri]|uniref:UPF3 domain-containing protein n=1 Tax=Ogataea philodendri TaxID=1378263 RepID=A0A9P8PFS1_9ASCO|nr:uncharacterized protein OGAPHI_000967 [Ogataea philodendri]KAH3670452.1 hypothetical protein OGAPHI_000967 [Ogataea philodendri]
MVVCKVIVALEKMEFPEHESVLDELLARNETFVEVEDIDVGEHIVAEHDRVDRHVRLAQSYTQKHQDRDLEPFGRDSQFRVVSDIVQTFQQQRGHNKQFGILGIIQCNTKTLVEFDQQVHGPLQRPGVEISHKYKIVLDQTLERGPVVVKVPNFFDIRHQLAIGVALVKAAETASDPRPKIVQNDWRLVVRKLPPLMMYEEFLHAIAGLKGVRSNYFVGGRAASNSFETSKHSRGYLSMQNEATMMEAVQLFKQLQFQSEGVEYKPVLEKVFNKKFTKPFHPNFYNDPADAFPLDESEGYAKYLQWRTGEIDETELRSWFSPQKALAKESKHRKKSKKSRQKPKSDDKSKGHDDDKKLPPAPKIKKIATRPTSEAATNDAPTPKKQGTKKKDKKQALTPSESVDPAPAKDAVAKESPAPTKKKNKKKNKSSNSVPADVSPPPQPLVDLLDPKFINEVLECVIGEQPMETAAIREDTQYFKALKDFFTEMFFGNQIVEDHINALNPPLLDSFVKGDVKCESVEDLALMEAIYHFFCLLLVASVRGKRMAWAMTNINYLPNEHKRVLERFSLIAEKEDQFSEPYSPKKQTQELSGLLAEKEEEIQALTLEVSNLTQLTQAREEELLAELNVKEDKLVAYDVLVAQLRSQIEKLNNELKEAAMETSLGAHSKLELFAFENRVLQEFIAILAQSSN